MKRTKSIQNEWPLNQKICIKISVLDYFSLWIEIEQFIARTWPFKMLKINFHDSLFSNLVLLVGLNWLGHIAIALIMILSLIERAIVKYRHICGLDYKKSDDFGRVFRSCFAYIDILMMRIMSISLRLNATTFPTVSLCTWVNKHIISLRRTQTQ